MNINAIEKWGTTIEEAVSFALTDLGLTENDVNVTVLEEPSKGFLGFGQKLAKVRVERKNVKEKQPEPKKEEKKPEKHYGPIGKEEVTEEERHIDRAPKEPREKRDNKKGHKSNKGEKNKKPLEEVEIPEERFEANIHEKPENLVPLEETPALDFLKTIADKMHLEVEIKAFHNDSCVYMEISGKDTGTFIGKRGATLDSIQYLTSLVVNKDNPGYTKVIVDAEDYREKREHTLEDLANRLAAKVLKSGKSVRLEPMNPYERKVIHATLQKYPGVNTRSEGEEPYRRVIIERIRGEKKSPKETKPENE